MVPESTASIQAVAKWKEVAEQLRRQNSLLKSILESPQGVIMFALDRAYRYTEFSRSHQETMQKIWGEKIDIGRNMLEVIKNADDREKARRHFDMVLQGAHLCLEEEYGDSALCRSYYENRYSPIFDNQNAVTGLTVFVIDITARKQAEETNAQLAAIVESSGDAVIGKNLEGIITSWNAGAEKLFGYSAKEMVGTSIMRLVLPERRRENVHILEQISKGESVRNFETVRQTKDGRLLEVSIAASPIKNATGKIIGVSKVARDLTARKQLEAQLRQSQKMEAFGQLAGGVAHDFNNILAAVILEIDLLLAGKVPAEVQEGLRLINTNAERAVNLTRQLLQFSRKQMVQSRVLDLSELITGVVQMLRRLIGEHIALITELPAGMAFVLADRSMLEQVLLNLALNARDAMPDGGQLLIRLQPLTVNATTAARHQTKPGSFLCLSVQDHGTGIPSEVLPRIFEPFFTTKDVGKGSGLGLSAVQGILAVHNGWVEVETELGQGTVFHLYLPQVEAKTVTATPPPLNTAPSGGTESILMVEDDSAFQAVLMFALKRLGYQIIPASSGKEALELWPAHRQSIGLLLTDIVMPKGWSGFQLAAQLQQDKPELKVIFMSGYPRENFDPNMDLQEGFNFLAKPFKPAVLAQLLRNRLDAANKSPG